MKPRRRWFEIALFLAGIIAIDVWLWSNAINAIWQAWDGWAFDRHVHGQPATVGQFLAEKEEQIAGQVESRLGIRKNKPIIVAPRPAWPVPGIGPDGMIGRLSIPRLHLSAMVREGAGEKTLSLALGHIPSTALPGQKGNVGVAGHRDRLFRGLKDIRGNDLIEFETLYGNYTYQVESTEIVKPNDVGVLKAADYSELTLVTCYPFYYVGSAPDRFIVKARQVSASLPAPPSPQAQIMAAPADQRVAAVPPSATKDRAPPAAQFIRTDLDARAPVAAPKRHARTVTFEVTKGHSRQLTTGVSIGLSETDTDNHRMNGWMWIAQDRHTIWLRRQSAHAPFVFYEDWSGKRFELVITRVSQNSVTGYLLLPISAAAGSATTNPSRAGEKS